MTDNLRVMAGYLNSIGRQKTFQSDKNDTSAYDSFVSLDLSISLLNTNQIIASTTFNHIVFNAYELPQGERLKLQWVYAKDNFDSSPYLSPELANGMKESLIHFMGRLYGNDYESRRALLKEAEQLILNSYLEAKEHFSDHEVQRNIVISDKVSGENEMLTTLQGSDIFVNLDLVKTVLLILKNAKESGDCTQLKEAYKHLKSQFIHEMVHRIRKNIGLQGDKLSEFIEVAPTAIQFLLVPDNSITYKALNELLRENPSTDNKVKALYYVAVKKALSIVRYELLKSGRCTFVPVNNTPQELATAIKSINPLSREQELEQITERILFSSESDFSRPVYFKNLNA